MKGNQKGYSKLSERSNYNIDCKSFEKDLWILLEKILLNINRTFHERLQWELVKDYCKRKIFW